MKYLKSFNVFGKLKMWQKLTLIAVLTGSTLPFITWQLVKAKNKDISFGQREIYGVEYLPPLRKLHEQVARHRDLTNGYLHGNSRLKEQFPLTQQTIHAAFQLLSDVDTRAVASTTYGTLFESSNKVNALKREWEAVRAKAANSTSAPEVFEQHNRLMNSIHDLMVHIADKSHLTLAPDLDTYYLMDAVIIQLPTAADALGQVRGLVLGAINSKTIAAPEQAQLTFQSARALTALGKVETGMRKAFEANAATGGDLASRQQQVISEAVREAKAFLKKCETFTPATNNAEQMFAEGTKAMDRLGILYETSRSHLEELLRKRINGFKNERNFVLAIVFAGLLFSLATVFAIVRSIRSQVSSLSHLVQEIERGNVEARAEVISQDELGALAASFNETLDSTSGLLQSRAERDALQRSIRRLLDEVSTVAEGDLTREAAVTEDITSALANSFNFMIAELRRVVGQVKEATTQVTNAAATTQTSSGELAQKVEQQCEQVHLTSQALEAMTASIQEVAQGAVLSASVAQQSLVNARQGTKAVQDTIQGLQRIREQFEGTSSRIRRLSDSSQEIGTIVQMIDEMADQTSLLAINASIKAAAAGDAGRGFAVVAEEIERLATHASQATAKISSLVKFIQASTNEAIAALEENNQEVAVGSKLALQAGQSLTEIENVSERLTELMQNISQASRKQTDSSETLSKAMTDISHLMVETTTGLHQSAVTINSLTALADELRASIASFKLPERNCLSE
jgi:twitching motility protein PilJ